MVKSTTEYNDSFCFLDSEVLYYLNHTIIFDMPIIISTTIVRIVLGLTQSFNKFIYLNKVVINLI